MGLLGRNFWRYSRSLDGVGRRLQRLGRSLLQIFLLLKQPLNCSIETIHFSIPRMTTSGPSNLPAGIDKVDISDLCVQKAHRIAHFVCQAPSDIAGQLDHEVLAPALLRNVLSDSTTEHLDYKCTHPVAGDVDIHPLQTVVALFEQSL